MLLFDAVKLHIFFEICVMKDCKNTLGLLVLNEGITKPQKMPNCYIR